MSTTLTASRAFALWVSPTGAFRLLDWEGLLTPEYALGCDATDRLDISERLTMWTDEAAIPLGRPRNMPVSELLRAYQPNPAIHYGEAVFTGAPNHPAASAHGLTEDRALTLLDLYLLRITARVPGSRRP
ncbi:hypothetical protein AB0E82_39555 [Streptomyces anulatus]|uniref:DUF3846 domain-containing protein n=1 Tax=Streptomyces anulatus TaxID=1892 RepID=UPI0033C0FD93